MHHRAARDGRAGLSALLRAGRLQTTPETPVLFAGHDTHGAIDRERQSAAGPGGWLVEWLQFDAPAPVAAQRRTPHCRSRLVPPARLVLPHLRTLHADKHWLLEFAPAALRSVAIDSHTRDFPLSSIDDLLLPARHYERGLSDVFPSLEEVCVIVAHKMDSVYLRQDAPVSVTPGCANSLSLLTHDLRQFEALNWLRTTCPASLRHLDMRVYFVAPFVERLARLCGHTSLDNRLVRQLYHFGLTTVVPPCGPRSVVLAVTRELDHPLLTGSGPTARALLERMQLPPPLLPTSLQSVALSLSPASLAFTLLPWVRCADAACASDEEPCLFIALHAEASSRYAQPLSAAALAFGALLASRDPRALPFARV